MARIKLELPDTFIYRTDLTLRITDINYGGHLANDAVLGIAHEARIRFLNSLGYSELDVEGKSLIMTDAVVVYKSQAYRGDKIVIEVTVQDISKLGFDVIYLISNIETAKEIARVKTGLAFFDYKTNKLSQVPDGFIAKVSS